MLHLSGRESRQYQKKGKISKTEKLVYMRMYWCTWIRSTKMHEDKKQTKRQYPTKTDARPLQNLGNRGGKKLHHRVIQIAEPPHYSITAINAANPNPVHKVSGWSVSMTSMMRDLRLFFCNFFEICVFWRKPAIFEWRWHRVYVNHLCRQWNKRTLSLSMWYICFRFLFKEKQNISIEWNNLYNPPLLLTNGRGEVTTT